MPLVVAIFMSIILIIFKADHFRLKALVTGLPESKMTQVEVTFQAEHECDLNWHIYLNMGLILGIAFWLLLDKIKTVKPWQRKPFANTVHVYRFLADTKHYVSIY